MPEPTNANGDNEAYDADAMPPSPVPQEQEALEEGVDLPKAEPGGKTA